MAEAERHGLLDELVDNNSFLGGPSLRRKLADIELEEDSPTIGELIRKKRRIKNAEQHNSLQYMDQSTTVPFNVMFQKSLFTSSRSKQSPQAETPHTPPQQMARTKISSIIDLVSPAVPEADQSLQQPERPKTTKDLAPPPQRTDMKRDSATLVKVQSEAKTASPTGHKKSGHNVKGKTPPGNPEAIRQRMAAQRIIDREVKGREDMLDRFLFGEAIAEDPQAKEQRLSDERTALAKKREAKMVEILQREEKEKLIALEKQRMAAEEAEAKRIEREVEEAAKKVKRDEERKKQKAAEAIEQNEKRRMAAERIEHARQEAERAAKEKAKEKLQGVEAAAEELAKMKAKQKKAKELASSLKATKMTNASEENMGDPKSGPEITAGENAKVSISGLEINSSEPDEDSLFVPEMTEHQRLIGMPIGPNNVTEVFAQHLANTGGSLYSIERDVAERKRVAQDAIALKARMDNRYKSKAVIAKPDAIKHTLGSTSAPEAHSSYIKPTQTGITILSAVKTPDAEGSLDELIVEPDVLDDQVLVMQSTQNSMLFNTLTMNPTSAGTTTTRTTAFEILPSTETISTASSALTTSEMAPTSMGTIIKSGAAVSRATAFLLLTTSELAPPATAPAMRRVSSSSFIRTDGFAINDPAVEKACLDSFVPTDESGQGASHMAMEGVSPARFLPTTKLSSIKMNTAMVPVNTFTSPLTANNAHTSTHTSTTSRVLPTSTMASFTTPSSSLAKRPLKYLTDDARSTSKPQTRFISDLEREQLDNATKSKQSVDSRRKSTEESKAKRRQKVTDKARLKKRQELRDQAEKNGEILDEIELNAQVDAFMEKRRLQTEKRAKTQRLREATENFAPDILAKHSRLYQSQRQQIHQQESSQLHRQFPEEELTLEQKRRKKNDAYTQASFQALSRQHGGTAAANNNTMKYSTSNSDSDSESASESEEDPMPEPEPTITKMKGSRGRFEVQGLQEEVSTDGNTPEENLMKLRKSHGRFEVKEQDEDMASTGSITSDEDSNVQQASQKSKSSTLSIPTNIPHGQSSKSKLSKPVGYPKPEDRIYAYYVQEAITFDGFGGEDSEEEQQAIKTEVGRCSSIKGANDFVRKRLAKLRQRQTRSIVEETDEDGLFSCKVIYDSEGKHQLRIWIECVVRKSGDVPADILDGLEVKLPLKIFEVWRYVTKEEVDKETGEVRVLYQDKATKHGSFSARKMANNVACEELCEFVKPKTPNLNHLDGWMDCVKQLREAKEQWNSMRNELFEAEVQRGEACPWLEVDRVSYTVVVESIQGPLN